jgi:tripartite-type tricarboxylate transporter receptor subunit TctC
MALLLTLFSPLAPLRSVCATYPERPIRLVVPLPAGGAFDSVGRLLAEKMSTLLGQPIVVENRVGAGGIVGTASVAKSAADGYTILLAGMGSLAAAASLMRLPYDPEQDLAPITRVSSYPSVLVVNPKLGVRTLGEFVARARANPKTLSFGTAGAGTMPHLGVELFQREAGIELVHVPYGVRTPALNDLLGGHIDLMFSGVPTVLSHVESGALVALAIGSESREPRLPDVPTTAELGLPRVIADVWNVLLAPGGTPPDILARLSAAAVAALADPGLQAELRKQGSVPMASTPEACAAFIRAERERWGPLVKDIGAASR